MSKHTTRPEADTGRPGPLTRVASTVVWYAPELMGVAASAGAAATVWAPLGAVGAALGAWIATDQVNIARARRALTQARRERAQLDAAEDNEANEHTAHEHAGGDTVSGDVSATDTATGKRTAEQPSGWEVAG